MPPTALRLGPDGGRAPRPRRGDRGGSGDGRDERGGGWSTRGTISRDRPKRWPTAVQTPARSVAPTASAGAKTGQRIASGPATRPPSRRIIPRERATSATARPCRRSGPRSGRGAPPWRRSGRRAPPDRESRAITQDRARERRRGEGPDVALATTRSPRGGRRRDPQFSPPEGGSGGSTTFPAIGRFPVGRRRPSEPARVHRPDPLADRLSVPPAPVARPPRARETPASLGAGGLVRPRLRGRRQLGACSSGPRPRSSANAFHAAKGRVPPEARRWPLP